MERVSNLLELRPQPLSRNRIERDVSGKAPYVRNAIDALIREGYATQIPGPRGARLVRLEHRFRESEDFTVFAHGAA